MNLGMNEDLDKMIQNAKRKAFMNQLMDDDVFSFGSANSGDDQPTEDKAKQLRDR